MYRIKGEQMRGCLEIGNGLIELTPLVRIVRAMQVKDGINGRIRLDRQRNRLAEQY